MATDERIKKLESVLRSRQPDLTVVIENVHDPHNVSAMLRSCDAVGIMEVQLLYTVEEFPEIGKKSSASASKWVHRRKFKTVQSCYNQLRREGYKIYATRLGRRIKSLYDLDLTQKVAVVFGNEHRGVSDKAAKEADELFRIPMFGLIESLNVSVACAVTLFEAAKQRLAAGDYKRPKLSQEQLNRLLKEWMLK